MTEFKRTVQAVDEIEQLIQRVMDSGGPAAVQQLSQSVGNTLPTIGKLRQKASETDPVKQTYGPQMREKVRALLARWDTIESLARDVLQQQGANVAAPNMPEQLPPPPAPAPPSLSTPWVPPRAAAAPAPAQATGTLAATPAAQSPAGGTATRADGPSRRELAARAAEARLQGGTAERPAPVAHSSGGGQASAASTPATASSLASSAGAASKPSTVQVQPPVPRVVRMDALLHLVHCVFLGHGFTRGDSGTDARAEEQAALPQGPGPVRVRYEHRSHKAITAMYVPVQSHLVVYASQDGAEAGAPPGRASVQLGMPAQAVQAKVDYLLLYPLVYRQCLPTMPSLPPEVCFSVLANLAIPALAVVGFASRSLKASVFDDDVLWWRVLVALPPSSYGKSAVEEAAAARRRGEAVKAGTYRRLVREEVERARAEALERRMRREAEARMREQLRDPLLVQPPRQPRPFPGGLGGMVIGGPDDLAPGGGFLPGPFGGGHGGRRPFGGGGGGFGGLF